MRLPPDDVAAIKDAAREAFGPTAVVRLFGSRLRDDARGGDIDLHVEVAPPIDEWRARGVFEDSVFRRIEPQKIDLIVSKRGGTPRGRADRVPRRRDNVTPEQEIIADQLDAIDSVVAPARETLPLIGSMPVDDTTFGAMTSMQRMATTAMLKEFEQLEGLLHGRARDRCRARFARAAAMKRASFPFTLSGNAAGPVYRNGSMTHAG